MIHLLISIWKMLDWQHSLFHSFHNLAVTEGQPLFCSSNHIHVFRWVAAASAVSVAVTVLCCYNFHSNVLHHLLLIPRALYYNSQCFDVRHSTDVVLVLIFILRLFILFWLRFCIVSLFFLSRICYIHFTIQDWIVVYIFSLSILPIFFSFWCVAILINFGSKPRFLCAVNVELNSCLYWKKQNNLTFIYSVQISYTRLLYLSIPAFVRSIGYNCSKLF